jgi:tetratricopeptide (TPR) repeat protein
MEQRDLGGFWGVPQEPGAVWQVDLFHLPIWMNAEEGDEPQLEMVWAAFGYDLPTGEIVMSRVAGAPEGALAVDALPELARRTGYRPERIQVTDLEVADKIRTALAAAPVTAEPGLQTTEVELREDLRELRTVFEVYRERVGRSEDAAAGSTGSTGAKYQAALYRCAEMLHDAGRHAEAVEPLQELLRLDRIDSAKARHLLADSLLHLRRHEDLEELLRRYRDASAFWTWPRVLLAFRLQGDSPEARRRLSDALQGNRFVPQMLLGPAPDLPSLSSRLLPTGSEDEARIYAAEGRAAWKATLGALEWLAARIGEGRKK